MAESLHDMIAVGGLKRLRHGTVGQCECSLLKLRHHTSCTEPGEHAAVLGRTRVLALSAGEIAEVGATLNQSIDRVNLSLGPGLLLGGLALGELKYMLRQHLACSGAACARPYDMKSERCFYHRRYLPLGSVIGRLLKYIGETSGSDVSHAAAVARGRTVNGIFARKGCEIRPPDGGGADAVEQRLVLLPLFGCLAEGHHYVARFYLYRIVGIGF